MADGCTGESKVCGVPVVIGGDVYVLRRWRCMLSGCRWSDGERRRLWLETKL